jgi:hypothetical protein
MIDLMELHGTNHRGDIGLRGWSMARRWAVSRHEDPWSHCSVESHSLVMMVDFSLQIDLTIQANRYPGCTWGVLVVE